MKVAGERKTNHFAIAGFLAPFQSAALICILLLIAEDNLFSSCLFPVYLTGVPLLLLAGIFFGVKSISFIEERGEKDYAYAGLTLNIFFLSVYVFSLFYFFSRPFVEQ